MHWRQQKEEARRRPKEMEAALAAAATLIPVPVATILVSASYAGCGSSRRSESLFAAPAARSDHPEGASRFRGAGVCSAQCGHPRRRRRVMSRASLWCSAAGLKFVTQVRLWALACAQAAKPPVQCRHRACICNNNARRAVVVGGMWHAGCGLRAAGCTKWYVFFNLNFDVAPLSLRLAKTVSGLERKSNAQFHAVVELQACARKTRTKSGMMHDVLDCSS
jgi:hypothetical protein